MRVRMVPIIVPVGVLVRHRLMRVLMPVVFYQMQKHPGQHQHAAQQHQPSRRALPEPEGHGGANERREGEHRPGSCGTKGPLCQKVEAQAQPIAGGAHREKPQRS